MADQRGRAIDDGEAWRDLRDGLSLLTPAEVRRVRALLTARGVEDAVSLLRVSALRLEECCVHGADPIYVEVVRRRLAALDRGERNPGSARRGIR